MGSTLKGCIGDDLRHCPLPVSIEFTAAVNRCIFGMFRSNLILGASCLWAGGAKAGHESTEGAGQAS